MRIAAVALALLVPAAAGADGLAIDPARSRVRVHLGRAGLAGFLGHTHQIEAPIRDGRVEIVADDPSRSSVRLAFEAARLGIVPGTEPASDVPSVEIRMRGPEVLDAESHPEITFESTGVSVATDGAGRVPTAAGGDAPGPAPLRLLVRGTLRLRGRPVEVAIPVEVRREARGLAAAGETWLELRTLGIEPPSVASVVKVANRFRLSFELHFGEAGAGEQP
jgi:polyisoprenoid-binding protein YceI